MSISACRGQVKRRTSGGWMESPFHGTPNIPLQAASETKECVLCLRESGGVMYSTHLSPPKPPVIPKRTGPSAQISITGLQRHCTLQECPIGGVCHSLAAWI